MEKLTHRTEVVEVHLEPCPNSDTLSLCKVWDYQCVLKTDQWKGTKLGAYVVPDSLVPNKEPFSFLFKPMDDEHAVHRVRVAKFRGNISMGLLVPAPKGAKLGDDVSKQLGVVRYEPPMKGESISRGPIRFKTLRKYTFLLIELLDKLHLPTQWIYTLCYRVGWQRALFAKAPEIYAPEYDVDSMYRYAEVFVPGEQILVTEKIHGTSARFVYHKGRYYCGSHHMWKPNTQTDTWWNTLRQYPDLMQWLKDNEGYVLYGEIYGDTQRNDGFGYGVPANQNRFAAFNILRDGKWLDASHARSITKYLYNKDYLEVKFCDIPWVPTICSMPFDLEELKELAEGPSTIEGANHIREGIVVLPVQERMDNRIGRVCLKLVSNGYLLKKETK